MLTKPLKVVHICQRDDPGTGGAVRVAVEYVKRLPQYGIDAHCLFLYGTPGYFQSELGDRAHYLEIANSQEFLKFRRLPQFLQDFQPQILHHHDSLLWSHLLTFFHPGTIKVAHAHTTASNSSLRARGALAAYLQRKSTDRLICITEHTRQTQIEQGRYLPDRTQVLYNGVDLDRFSPSTPTDRAIARTQFGIPSSAPVVGWIGRLHCKMKGTDDFLKLMALLPSQFWGLVVGIGPDIDALKHLATTLGIADRLIFTGLIANTTVAYHAMDVFCLTSHWEPFGLVVAEAMACQIPVIGFLCEGGINELLTSETGCILPSRNLQAMARAVIEAVQHPDRWNLHRKRAESRLKQHHDWEQNASCLALAYQQLLQSRTNGAKADG
jgi:glycosyltransferase involved in cell wall biosynthesis